MAYMLSHLELGRRVRAQIDPEKDRDDSLFLLGCLGPDVFFYDRFPPPLFRRHEKKLGNAFHNLDAADWFVCSRDARLCVPYICGMLCHFALDATVHPYIESQATGTDHSRFEAAIDSLLLPAFANPARPLAGLPPVAAIAPVDAFWEETSAALFGKQVKGVFTRSYRNFLTTAKLLFDPSGRKTRFVRILDFGARGRLSGFFVSPGRADEDDCLNEKHRDWAPPWALGDLHSTSFCELFEIALKEAVALVRLYLDEDADAVARALTRRSMQRGKL